jgi:hypothetical protein
MSRVEQTVASLLLEFKTLTDELLQINLSEETELQRLIQIQNLQSIIISKVDELTARQGQEVFQMQGIHQLGRECLEAEKVLNEKMQVYRVEISKQLKILKSANKVKNSYQTGYSAVGGFFVDKHH